MPRPTRDTLLSISAIGPAANPSGDIVKCESTLSPRREEETRGSATALLLAASVASLLGVGFSLVLAAGTAVYFRCCSLASLC